MSKKKKRTIDGTDLPTRPPVAPLGRGKALAAAQKTAGVGGGAMTSTNSSNKKQRVHKLTGTEKLIAVDKFLTSKGAICLDRSNIKELLSKMIPCCEDGHHSKVIFDVPGYSSMHRACSFCTAVIKPADESEDHRIPKTTIFCQEAMKNTHPLILRRGPEALLFLCDKQRWIPLNRDDEVEDGANPLSCWDIMHLPRARGLDLVQNGVAPYNHYPWGPSSE
jgi:hypothetical protein